MSQELKELLELILPDLSGQYEEFNSIGDYIQKLGAYSYDNIVKEPLILSEEKKRITEQTQELAFTNYKTFVETAGTSRVIMKDFATSKESLDEFMVNLPTFVSQCENFSGIASQHMKEKKSFRNLRCQSDKILEILELPVLMKEALNIEDYESALDIFTFVRNLSQRYAQIPIIQNTTSEIMTLWFETLYHLYNQLRYDLPLPQCLQILGYLRRASTVYKWTNKEDGAVFSGSQYATNTTGSRDGLHLHFLKARSAWFENALEEAKNTETSDKILRKLIELHRIHLFNVLTQHKSIFLSDSQDSKSDDAELNGTSALSCWLKQKVSNLADILNNNLLNEDESSFESLYNQCMYLCLSFGRVGADMRCVLTPLFRKNLLTVFYCSINKADFQFDQSMKNYKVPSMKNIPRPSTTNLPTGPPESLLDYYPLAEYCNGLLSILNCLRLTAPLDLVKDVYKCFRMSLEKSVNVLAQFYHKEQQAFTDIEKQNFVALCTCYVDEFLPYIVKCLAQTFSPSQIADHLGVTLTVLQESKILYLNQSDICAPLTNITMSIGVLTT